MSGFREMLIRLADQRVKAGVAAAAGGTQTTVMGTVIDRTGPNATVVFDNGGGAAPCKAFSNVVVYPDDRVGLLRFGPDWVIVGVYTPTGAPPLFENSMALSTTPASGSTNSTTIASINAPSSLAFVKLHGSATTTLEIGIENTFFTTNASTGVDFGVLVNGVDTIPIAQVRPVTVLNSHIPAAGTERLTQLLDAGPYTIQMRWRINGAANNVTMDSGDQLSMTVREVKW